VLVPGAQRANVHVALAKLVAMSGVEVLDP
jgi:hypothetical protein